MRVLIEFFDKEPVENLLASCIFSPEIVVFLCDKRDITLFKEQNVYRFLRKRKLKSKVRFYYFDGRSPDHIRRVLHAVVRDYPGCVFDYSGGNDLVLLTGGVFAAEQDLPGFYIDIQRECFINVNRCEDLERKFHIPDFSAEDIMAQTGAAVRGYGHFTPDDLDSDFEEDILKVWPVVHKNPKGWSDFVSALQTVTNGSPIGQLEVMRKPAGKSIYSTQNRKILEQLSQAGILYNVHLDKNWVRIGFKNPKIKRSLLVAGVWLELYCYLVAKECGCFNDVRTSVVIDWDYEDKVGTAKNEVDVLLVKGVVPVFISCKLSAPSPLALSEIRLLSGKFAGGFGRTMVLCDAALNKDNRSLQCRAREMGVILLGRDDLEPEVLKEHLIRATLPDVFEPDPMSLKPPDLMDL